MICTKKPRELSPGDLYVMTAFAGIMSRELSNMKVGDIRTTWMEGRMKLLERHPCGALEFLILPPQDTP